MKRFVSAVCLFFGAYCCSEEKKPDHQIKKEVRKLFYSKKLIQNKNQGM